MFRISMSSHEQIPTICVEGSLDGKSVPDLRKTCDATGPGVCLKLSGLMSADAEGVRLLRSLQGQGAELHDVSPYIHQLLQRDAH